MSVQLVELEQALVNFTTDLLADDILVSQSSGDSLWMVFCGALVFFMHAGFAMLEAGNIRKTSVINIMFKNIATVSIGVVTYWFLGYAFAYGEDFAEPGRTSFIGVGDYLASIDDLAFWFFQMVFAATAATIVSGAVAGRIKLRAYFVIAICLTGFVYPVVSHWIWAKGGWLSAFTEIEDLFLFSDDNPEDPVKPCGVIDFAGSGVVHMTGGVAAFWGALILGPRAGWSPGDADFAPHNFALATLGTFILWFGWYGFNAGSTLAWSGVLAGHIAVTTTLSPAASCVVGIALARVQTGTWNLSVALNCIIGGLVSITAGCATVNPGAAIIIGALGALVYYFSSGLLQNRLGIDDPVDAAAVHGFCGLWGLIAVALFSDGDLVFSTYSDRACDTGVGRLLQWQLLAAVVILAWVSAFAILIFGLLRVTGQLKLADHHQDNVDATEHGAAAYEKID